MRAIALLAVLALGLLFVCASRAHGEVVGQHVAAGHARRHLLNKAQKKTASSKTGTCNGDVILPGIAGYGTSVSLDCDGGALVVGAYPILAPDSSASVTFIKGRRCKVQAPTQLRLPDGVDPSKINFGTKVKVSADGKVILVVASNMEITSTQGAVQSVDVGYIYRKPTFARRPKYDLVATLSVPVNLSSLDPSSAVKRFQLDTVTGTLSDDGCTAVIGFTGSVVLLEDGIFTDVVFPPGVVNVFSAPTYGLSDQIPEPPEIRESAGSLNTEFGTNLAISGDGNVLAVSGGVSGGLYVYEKGGKRQKFSSVQVLSKVVPDLKSAIVVQDPALSYDGTYLSYTYASEGRDGICILARSTGGGSKGEASSAAAIMPGVGRAPRNEYKLVCNQNTTESIVTPGVILREPEGVAMADLDGYQRVVAGFYAYGAVVYDFKHADLACGKCPRSPITQLVYPGDLEALANNYLGSSLDISGDGLLVAQGLPTFNATDDNGAVILTSLKHPQDYDK